VTEDAPQAPASALPDALAHLDEIVDAGPMALFLDYDGTLSPIVPRPEDALLPEMARRPLARLAEHVPVGVLSGRDLEDVRSRVGIPGLWYAGSHGYDITGPHGEHSVLPEESQLMTELGAARRRAEALLDDYPGARLEPKRFSFAVHHRQLAQAHGDALVAAMGRLVADHPRLRSIVGKKVVEVQPDVAWHKGKALRWLMEIAGLTGRAVPVYVGDDTTDEDAFREIRGDGIGIVVADEPRRTAARYRLDAPDQVARLLEALVQRLG
jgi:trehalose-phosphatase